MSERSFPTKKVNGSGKPLQKNMVEAFVFILEVQCRLAKFENKVN